MFRDELPLLDSIKITRTKICDSLCIFDEELNTGFHFSHRRHVFSHNKSCLFVARRRETYRRLCELDAAIAVAFRDDEHTRFEKTRRQGEKWRTAFNSSSKIHNNGIFSSE